MPNLFLPPVAACGHGRISSIENVDLCCTFGDELGFVLYTSLDYTTRDASETINSIILEDLFVGLVPKISRVGR